MRKVVLGAVTGLAKRLKRLLSWLVTAGSQKAVAALAAFTFELAKFFPLRRREDLGGGLPGLKGK
jgi:hypothetical protein